MYTLIFDELALFYSFSDFFQSSGDVEDACVLQVHWFCLQTGTAVSAAAGHWVQ
jgi:hypothetical protein